MPEIAFRDRLDQVRSVIADRQRSAGWAHPVRIVAVTKGHDAAAVRVAADGGLDCVGENRVQEALDKQDACADVRVEWHLIGTLQRRKARQVIGRFALIHSIDSVDLATELHRRIGSSAVQPVLVQVNCSGEPQKGGVDPDKLDELLSALEPLHQLEIRGLMTMAALTADEREQRRTFARLRELRDAQRAQGRTLTELSMGMSGDFPAAVEEGATMVRLGTILFGSDD